MLRYVLLDFEIFLCQNPNHYIIFNNYQAKKFFYIQVYKLQLQESSLTLCTKVLSKKKNNNSLFIILKGGDF